MHAAFRLENNQTKKQLMVEKRLQLMKRSQVTMAHDKCIENRKKFNMTRPQSEGVAFTMIDRFQSRKLAESIKRFEFNFDRFDDPLLYPNAEVDSYRVALFFFFIVAIDHRTHPQGKIYKGRVGGVELTGAELMYALAMRRFNEDASFFTAERMSKISREEIGDLFRVKEPEIMDIAGADERANLLRDCGIKLQRHFNGSALNIVSKSGGFLSQSDGSGFIHLLRRFDAYQDPLSKKPFLLVKFLERRHILSVKDPENLHVPVDNILQRLALRTGILRLTKQNLIDKIRNDKQVDSTEEETIRQGTMLAFDEVAKGASLSTAYLDDILWELGRVHCRVPVPICDSLPRTESRRPYRIIKFGPIGECPFGPGCQGYCDKARWKLKEPNFKTTFY
jgi:hypothetical protein